MNGHIEDLASLTHWFWENYETFIEPFVEQHFKEESWAYELGYYASDGIYYAGFMYRHLIYTKAIIEDYKMTEEEKVLELLDAIYHGKSKIILVVGSRGSGKTGTSLWFGEEAHLQAGHRYVYYVGTPENPEIYPSYFRFVDALDKLPNGVFAVIDEAAIKYSARNFGKTENKELTDEMVIARHKGITLVLITQNISLVDVNVDRLADIIIYKMAANYGIRPKRGERFTKEMKERNIIMKRMKPRSKEDCLVEYLTGVPTPIFRKFTNPLPSFWDDEKVSKSFKHYKAKAMPQEVQQTADDSPY